MYNWKQNEVDVIVVTVRLKRVVTNNILLVTSKTIGHVLFLLGRISCPGPRRPGCTRHGHQHREASTVHGGRRDSPEKGSAHYY